jgi:two-component system cell cycle response regulator DivK
MPGNKLILHVEDNFENRVLVRRLLLSEGYEVVEAENANQAVKILESRIPDLILMDINMPDMDGYTLTSSLKSRNDLQMVPIVAITANVMRGDRERVFRSGCNGYIEKPIDVDRFLDQVASFMDRAGGESAS